jgi:hypothetical protein
MGDFNTPDYPGRPSSETPDFNFNLGVNFVLDEYFGDYRPTDAQFSLANNADIRPGLDIINPRTKDRILITHGSDHAVESKLSKLITKKRLGATVLTLVTEIPDRSISASSDEFDSIQIYQIPSGARLLAPSIKDPSYNVKYIERLCFKLGSIMNLVRNSDDHLFDMSINSIAVVNGNDDEAEDDTRFAFVPPVNVQPRASDIVNDSVMNFIPSDEYPENFVESYRNGVGRE